MLQFLCQACVASLNIVQNPLPSARMGRIQDRGQSRRQFRSMQRTFQLLDEPMLKLFANLGKVPGTSRIQFDEPLQHLRLLCRGQVGDDRAIHTSFIGLADDQRAIPRLKDVRVADILQGMVKRLRAGGRQPRAGGVSPLILRGIRGLTPPARLRDVSWRGG